MEHSLEKQHARVGGSRAVEQHLAKRRASTPASPTCIAPTPAASAHSRATARPTATG